MMRLVSLTLLSVLLASVTASPAPSPVRFMCDVCEGNFLSCMVHCSLERFITRDQFDRWILKYLKYNQPLICSGQNHFLIVLTVHLSFQQ